MRQDAVVGDGPEQGIPTPDIAGLKQDHVADSLKISIEDVSDWSPLFN